MLITNFIFGIFIIAVGVIILKMNYQFTNMFSKNNIIERKLGSGSSYGVAKLFALLVIFWGFLMMFSLHDNLISLIFSPITDALGY